jgi:drug/metabolite transporter (DMT)-like permease
LSPLYAGEVAALGTALFWSFSSIFFTIAGRRVGSLMVNRWRLLAAVLLVGAMHFILYGRPYPANPGSERLFWLGLSAILGLVLGDSLLFQAYVYIGTRLAMLLMALAPIFGTLVAWLLLGETLTLPELLAILMSVGGVAWVVLGRAGAGEPAGESASQSARPLVKGSRLASLTGGGHATTRRQYFLGILCGLGGALGQALGLVTAKRGMVADFPALSAVVIRMVVAMLVLWTWAAVRGQLPSTLRVLHHDRRTGLAILGGATTGPFLGVWLSLIGVQLAPVGIASTLNALTPILLIPLVYVLFREKTSPRAFGGTLLAMGGVALMFLR